MGSQYCQPADMIATGINSIALNAIPTADLQTACQQASELADSWGFRPRYGANTPVLLAWGGDVTYNAALVAVYLAMRARGYNPSAGADDNIFRGYSEAQQWFRDIGHGNVTPDVSPNVPIGQNQGADLPQVSTSQQRGWLTKNGNGTPTVGW